MKSSQRVLIEKGLVDLGITIGNRQPVFNDKNKITRRYKFCGVFAIGKEKVIEDHFLTLGLKVKVGHLMGNGYNFYAGLTIKIKN